MAHVNSVPLILSLSLAASTLVAQRPASSGGASLDFLVVSVEGAPVADLKPEERSR